MVRGGVGVYAGARDVAAAQAADGPDDVAGDRDGAVPGLFDPHGGGATGSRVTGRRCGGRDRGVGDSEGAGPAGSGAGGAALRAQRVVVGPEPGGGRTVARAVVVRRGRSLLARAGHGG